MEWDHCPNARTSLQQRQRQSLSAAARQDRVPSEQPRQHRASAKRWRFMLRLRLGKEVGGDQRRPVSQASSTSLALPWRPVTLDTSTLFVCGHATEPVHPELGCALFQRRNESGVQGAPWNNGNPSATTSRRRASRPVLWHKVQIPHTFVVTRVRASQTLSKANARRLNTPASARCPVVAKRVEKTATPTEVRWGGRACQTRRRSGTRKREESNRECGVVGKHMKGMPTRVPLRERRGVLPTVSQLTWFPNVPLIRQRTRTCCQIFSRRWMETLKLQEFH